MRRPGVHSTEGPINICLYIVFIIYIWNTEMELYHDRRSIQIS